MARGATTAQCGHRRWCGRAQWGRRGRLRRGSRTGRRAGSPRRRSGPCWLMPWFVGGGGRGGEGSGVGVHGGVARALRSVQPRHGTSLNRLILFTQAKILSAARSGAATAVAARFAFPASFAAPGPQSGPVPPKWRLRSAMPPSAVPEPAKRRTAFGAVGSAGKAETYCWPQTRSPLSWARPNLATDPVYLEAWSPGRPPREAQRCSDRLAPLKWWLAAQRKSRRPASAPRWWDCWRVARAGQRGGRRC